MLEIKDLSIYCKDRYLVKDLSFNLNNGDKLAIIGEEGNGKSTLLKTILGKCNYAEISGKINLKNNKVGYLEQYINENDLNKTCYDYLFINENDYYTKLKKLYKNLEILNISDKLLNQKIKTLSGGEKVKIGLLKLLLEDNDILFLDEPTNDLDIKTLEWLENFIINIDKPIIYISHDETLLSKTANMILHLEQIKNKTEPRHTILKSNYDSYIENRLRMIEKESQLAKFEKKEFMKKQEKLNQIMNKVEHEQNVISRKDPHGAQLLKKKMHSLKSQEKKLNNIKLTEKRDIEEGINFHFDEVNIPPSKVILDLKIDYLKVENNILSKNIELKITGNTHLCIIGRNGVGKTTLIKEIYNNLKNRKDIKVGYMPQDYDEILKSYKQAIDFLIEGKNKEEITKARMFLGSMKFTREEMLSKTTNLSSGTKAKLCLIKLVLDGCNVLILDEPTRNVSPLSNPVIRKVLKEFNGTIISVSHDRKYISEVINKLYTLTKNGLIEEKLN